MVSALSIGGIPGFFHDVKLFPKNHVYYSTSGTDRLLDLSGNHYWLYQSSNLSLLDRGLHVDKSYSISFVTYVKECPSFIVKGLPIAAAGVYHGVELGIGDIPIDLDQTFVSVATSNYVVYPGLHQDLGGPAMWQEGDFMTRTLLPVFIEGTSDEFIPGLGGRIAYLPALKRGGTLHPIVDFPYTHLAIFGSAEVLERNLFTFYLSRIRSEFRSLRTDIPYYAAGHYCLPRPVIGDDFESAVPPKDGLFIEFIKSARETFGVRDLGQIKAMLRYMGAMIRRCDVHSSEGRTRERYYMSPELPGIANAASLWSKINSHRQVRLIVHLTHSQRIQWLYILRINGLVAYWDKVLESLVILDPYSPNNLYLQLVVQVSDGEAAIGASPSATVRYNRQLFGYETFPDETYGEVVSHLEFFFDVYGIRITDHGNDVNLADVCGRDAQLEVIVPEG